jgi:hypothetical protein
LPSKRAGSIRRPSIPASPSAISTRMILTKQSPQMRPKSASGSRPIRGTASGPLTTHANLAYGARLRRNKRITDSRDPLRVARDTSDHLGAVRRHVRSRPRHNGWQRRRDRSAWVARDWSWADRRSEAAVCRVPPRSSAASRQRSPRVSAFIRNQQLAQTRPAQRSWGWRPSSTGQSRRCSCRSSCRSSTDRSMTSCGPG